MIVRLLTIYLGSTDSCVDRFELRYLASCKCQRHSWRLDRFINLCVTVQ